MDSGGAAEPSTLTDFLGKSRLSSRVRTSGEIRWFGSGPSPSHPPELLRPDAFHVSDTFITTDNNMNSFMNLNEVDKGISETRGHTSPHDDTSLLCNLTFNNFFSKTFSQMCF